MNARSLLIGVAAAGTMVVGSAMGASANISWCLGDPPVQVQTDAGTNLTVNTMVGVPQGQAKYINDVVIDAVTAPDGVGGTMVTVHVTVPSTVTVARVSATVKKFKITDSATVPGGGSATLHLDLPTT